MKKIFIFVAALMMTAFVGCGQKAASNENADLTAEDSIFIDSIEEVGDSVVPDSLICND